MFKLAAAVRPDKAPREQIGRLYRVFRWLRSLLVRPDPPAAFAARRAEWLALWFRTAAASGRPKGLTWAGYEELGEPVFARDLALVPVQVQFDPHPDGPLADVPQAREPRPVVAVFRWERGRWTTDGRAVFNLTPQQVAEQVRVGQDRTRSGG